MLPSGTCCYDTSRRMTALLIFFIVYSSLGFLIRKSAADDYRTLRRSVFKYPTKDRHFQVISKARPLFLITLHYFCISYIPIKNDWKLKACEDNIRHRNVNITFFFLLFLCFSDYLSSTNLQTRFALVIIVTKFQDPCDFIQEIILDCVLSFLNYYTPSLIPFLPLAERRIFAKPSVQRSKFTSPDKRREIPSQPASNRWLTVFRFPRKKHEGLYRRHSCTNRRIPRLRLHTRRRREICAEGKIKKNFSSFRFSLCIHRQSSRKVWPKSGSKSH